jgi:hypothetical protein
VRKVVVCAFLLLLACQPERASVAASAGPATDAAYVDRFLQAWLLSEDPLKGEQFLSHNFKLQNDTAGWPAVSRSATEVQRALLFARSCNGAPPQCDTLASCIRPIDGRRGTPFGYDLETVTVTDEMIAANSHLREWRGRTVMHLSFMLIGCNLGTSILIEPNGASDARVLSIFYLAG